MEHISNSTTAQPRMVLLHGAGLGRWIWDDVVPHLGDGIGEPLDLPGRGPGANPDEVTLQDCVSYVRTELDRFSAPTVLVGHSCSAEVALAVAAAAPASIDRPTLRRKR